MYFPNDQPADEESRPRAVITLLHGYGGCGQDWFEQTSAARYAGDNGLVLIAPDCGNSFYHNMMYGGAYRTFLIEELPVHFTAVATDILHRREVVFGSGSLYDAIRSSISLPSVFTPNRIGDMLLIDGGVVNPVPVNRVRRLSGDILVVVDLNGPYEEKEDDVSVRGWSR